MLPAGIYTLAGHFIPLSLNEIKEKSLSIKSLFDYYKPVIMSISRQIRIDLRLIFIFTIFIISSTPAGAQESEPAVLTNWSYIPGAKLIALENPDLAPPEFWKIKPEVWQNFPDPTARARLKSDANGLLWLRVKLPEFNPGPGVESPGLHMTYIHQTFEVYTSREGEGNRLLYKFGEIKQPGKGVFDGWPSHFIKLDPSLSGRFLYFRMYSNSGQIGILSPARLLPYSQMLRESIRSDLDRLLLGVLCILLGGFVLVAALRRRSDSIYLYFSLFTFSMGLYFVSNRMIQIQYQIWDAPRFWYYLEFLSMYLVPGWLGAFINQIAPRRFLSYMWKVFLVFWVFALFGQLSGFLPFYLTQPSFFYITLFVCIYVLGLVGLEAFRGNREARIFGQGLFIFLCFSFYDLLGVLGIIYWARQTLALAMFCLLIFLGKILIGRFREVHVKMRTYANRLEKAKENLEDKVTERTKELSDSLVKIQNLKKTQDGDYFLTSLLMKPFIRLEHSDSRYVVDMLVRQNKNFFHNKRKVELGGDICNLQPLKLGDKNYLAFLNGDAMGKSMQGAGGAIVLGVIYESLIHREISDKHNGFVQPGDWLRHCMRELQYAFLRFNGAMLASVIIGLLSEETGEVFYVNAEHPSPVLYRNQKAVLLPNKGMLPKLGLPVTKTNIPISLLRLKDGDSFLVGSDGRDDIITGVNEQGERIINSDETAFLKAVENVRGRLERLEEEIKKMGEPADDLSLICIHRPL